MGLRGRFLLLVVGIYLVVGALAVLGFFQVAGKIVRSLGASYATQYAQQQKGHILAKIDRELVLAQKLVDSPLLQRWAQNESDPALRKLALEELDSFRRLFADKSVFFVIDKSKNYYFSDGKRPLELRYTIKPGDPTTAWYAATIEQVDDFALHVDHSEQLGLTNVWINAIVKQDGKKVGLGGSGLDLTEFLKEVVHSPEPGVQTILVNGQGFVQGHSDQQLMEANARIKEESKRLKIDNLVDDPGVVQAHLQNLIEGRTQVETFELVVDKRPMLAAATYMKEIDWIAVVLVDPAQVVRSRQFLPILGLLAISFLATILLVSMMIDRLILSRLARLTGQTREIAAGRYDVLLTVDREDEIGHLTESFNHMTATIRDYTHNLERKVEERTEELTRSKAQLEAINTKLMSSIHYARLIQSALLAKPAELARLLPQHVVYWRPRDVVGGDFYAIYEDPDGGLLLAVADCTGHGVPGAFMTMATKALLDSAVAQGSSDDPAALLGDLNRTLRALLLQDGSNGVDLALLRIAPDRRKMVFAAGKMSLWVQYGTGFQLVRGDKMSLGYDDSDQSFRFTNHTLDASPGIRYFLMTDGVLDQAGGPKGYGLGVRRLQEALAGWKGEPIDRLEALLDNFVREWQGALAQRDDITVVAFQL